MSREIFKDGYRRVAHDDCVDWYIDRPNEPFRDYTYCVARFPFVPEYHLCDWLMDDDDVATERPLQQFKTLAEALAVLRVLDANSPEDT